MERVNLSLIHNRLGRGTSQKPVSVEIRFSCGSKRKYVSTGVKLCPGQWSTSNSRVVRCKDADELNRQIDSIYGRAKKVRDKMNEEGITDLSCVVQLLDKKEKEGMDFISYCEVRMKERNVSEHTKQRYKVFIEFLKKWGQIRFFSDLTTANVRAMDEHLHAEGKMQSTVYCYHKYLKLFIRDACIDNLVERSPYFNLPFKIPKGDNEFVDYLPYEKFQKLKRLSFQSGHLERAKDLFLMQCYTGLAYSDLMKFDFKDCQNVGGKWFYKAKRTKTNTDFALQLLNGAVTILAKYNYELPQLSNQKYNDYLKVIGSMIGEPKLHSHTGRGTAATLFLSFGMPLNIVAKVLGHTNIRQTQRYARTLNKDVKAAFDNLEGKM